MSTGRAARRTLLRTPSGKSRLSVRGGLGPLVWSLTRGPRWAPLPDRTRRTLRDRNPAETSSWSLLTRSPRMIPGTSGIASYGERRCA